jgi:hypothetical protein
LKVVLYLFNLIAVLAMISIIYINNDTFAMVIIWSIAIGVLLFMNVVLYVSYKILKKKFRFLSR